MINEWDALMEKDDELLEYEKQLRREDKLENCLKLREWLNPETKTLVRGKWPCGLIECPTCLEYRAERLRESLGRVFEMAPKLEYLEVDAHQAPALVHKLRKLNKRYARFPVDNSVAFVLESSCNPGEMFAYSRVITNIDDLDLEHIARTRSGYRISNSFGVKMFPNQRMTENDPPDDGDDIVKINVPHLRYDGSVDEKLRDETWRAVLDVTSDLNPRTAEALERDLLTVTALYQDWIRQALRQNFEAEGIPPERAAAKAHLAVMMGKRRKNVNLTRLDWKKVNELGDNKAAPEDVQSDNNRSTWWRDMQQEGRDIII